MTHYSYVLVNARGQAMYSADSLTQAEKMLEERILRARPGSHVPTLEIYEIETTKRRVP